MNEDGYRGRGRLKKRWMQNVKDDMIANTVTWEMTSDRIESWKKKTLRRSQTINWDKGRVMMIMIYNKIIK